jgi:tRNA G26 N,N-dimethylase Trm1
VVVELRDDLRLRVMESKKEGNKTFVSEYNVRLLVDKNSTCPKKSEVFYNEEVTLNRLCWF